MKLKKSDITNAFTPSRVLQARAHRRVFTQFAEKTGLVYFGYVNQRDDEHRLVRGLTQSAYHKDENYCIGSHEGYDITLVQRSDMLSFPGKPKKNHTWLIMTFDLHARVDLPHMFLGLHTHGETFYSQVFTKFPQLAKVPLGHLGVYAGTFASRYALYSPVAQLLVAQRLFGGEVAQKIMESFGSLTLEVTDNVLYVYSEHQRPTQALLGRMLTSGLWLAKKLDEEAARL